MELVSRGKWPVTIGSSKGEAKEERATLAVVWGRWDGKVWWRILETRLGKGFDRNGGGRHPILTMRFQAFYLGRKIKFSMIKIMGLWKSLRSHCIICLGHWYHNQDPGFGGDSDSDKHYIIIYSNEYISAITKSEYFCQLSTIYCNKIFEVTIHWTKFSYKISCDLNLQLYSISFYWRWILTNPPLDDIFLLYSLCLQNLLSSINCLNC